MLGLILLLLVVSGVGQYIWRNATQIGSHCSAILREVGFNEYQSYCRSMGHSMMLLQRNLEGMLGSTKFGDTMNLEEFAGFVARQLSGAAIGFSAPQLSQFIDPSLLKSPAEGADPFKLSLTRGAYGDAMLKNGNMDGLPYLKSSANMGESGLLSQLSLGSAYANGDYGLPKNPDLARDYYTQAQESLQTLQGQNSPQSNQLLESLPASPDAIRESLNSALGGGY